jgi:hypothetical protein
MSNQSLPPKNERLSLKQNTGWFPAGDPFRQALNVLSDGAFRLFVYLCLEADRGNGRFQATHKELALALGKSKRAVGAYITELEARGICGVSSGKNQFSPTIFQIADSYWPYHRLNNGAESSERESYVESVRTCFLSLGCGSGKFGAPQVKEARNLQRRDIPLEVIEAAMLMGACRKYSSWFEGRASEPIQSLRYFDQIIAEIQKEPLPSGYSAYLREKIGRLAVLWSETVKSGTPTRKEQEQLLSKETLQ